MATKIQLGDKVEDKVTGLIGFVISKTEYYDGYVQYTVQPKVNKDNEIVSRNIPEAQLEVIKANNY